jgi:hypothetical protein
VDNSTVFFIGACQAEKSVDEVKELLSSDKQFAILLPTGLLSEISRKENVHGGEVYDKEFKERIFNLSKIVPSQEGETWLIRVNDEPKTIEVLTAENVDSCPQEIMDIFTNSLEELILQISVLPDWHGHNREVNEELEVYLDESDPLPRTLRSSKLKRSKLTESSNSKERDTNSDSSQIILEPKSNDSFEPMEINSKTSNFNKFEIEPIKSWLDRKTVDRSENLSVCTQQCHTNT